MGTSAPAGIRLGTKAKNVCVHCNGQNSDPLKADSHIACHSHAASMPFPWQAAPLRV